MSKDAKKMSKDAKKMPKFVNFDAEMIGEQMVAAIAEANKEKLKKDDNDNDNEHFMQEFNEDLDDGLLYMFLI